MSWLKSMKFWDGGFKKLLEQTSDRGKIFALQDTELFEDNALFDRDKLGKAEFGLAQETGVGPFFNQVISFKHFTLNRAGNHRNDRQPGKCLGCNRFYNQGWPFFDLALV